MPSRSSGADLREEAKQYYRDKQNIEAKWLDQYGNVSRDNDYQRNRSCLSELFNMLDVVMEICIEDFRRSHVMTHLETFGRNTTYTCRGDDGQDIVFSTPSVFAKRVTALRAIGYPISNELFYDTRFLRNETAHGNQTVILQHMELGYDETMKAVLSIADALICLGKLDSALREPSFEKLRVREGDTLLNGVYTIGRLIGEGGMSRVYEATQKRLGRKLAVKELKPGTYAEELIRNECDVLARLHHDQIPQIHDTFSENSTYYIVMSCVEGVTLDRYIADLRRKENQPAGAGRMTASDPLTIAEKAPAAPAEDSPAEDSSRSRIALSLLDVLDYLHSPEVNLVFADLSPDNIMIDPDGTPYLIDFGISSEAETRQKLPAATLGYSAPELFTNSVLDQRADIYSYGYILRFLYTGLNPLEETERPTTELIADERIASVVNRCTARNPEERFATIDALRDALFPETSKRAKEEAREAKVRARKRQNRRILLAAGALIIAGVVCLAVFVGSRMRGGTSPTAGDTSGTGAESSASAAATFDSLGLTVHVMVWNDDALETAMRQNTGISEGDILLSDVWKAAPDTLELENAGISDISALSEMTWLNELHLGGNQITDLTPLGSLPDLSVLYLTDNPVTSEKAAQTGLSSDRMTVKDDPNYAVLSGLRNLTALEISGCGISDLSWIRDLDQLEVLSAGDNQITDLSPLAGHDTLTELVLENNPIGSASEENADKKAGSDPLQSLSGLTNLKWLDLKNCGISDISALTSLTSVDHMDLSVNGIRDLAPVGGMKGLVYLDASDNRISDLTPLSGLTQLTLLDLGSNEVAGGLDALSGLALLNKLDLHGNRISDITALKNFTMFQMLDLSENDITDYSVLDGIKIEDLRV